MDEHRNKVHLRELPYECPFQLCDYRSHCIDLLTKHLQRGYKKNKEEFTVAHPKPNVEMHELLAEAKNIFERRMKHLFCKENESQSRDVKKEPKGENESHDPNSSNSLKEPMQHGQHNEQDFSTVQKVNYSEDHLKWEDAIEGESTKKPQGMSYRGPEEAENGLVKSFDDGEADRPLRWVKLLKVLKSHFPNGLDELSDDTDAVRLAKRQLKKTTEAERRGTDSSKGDTSHTCDVCGKLSGTNCIKIGLPGKLILSKRKGLREVLFS